MMACECIIPPPKFDIPPPPDPSLIWHLLSDERADELIQIQQCDIDGEGSSNSEVSSSFSTLPNYFLDALLASGALISTALLVIIVCIRIRRSNKKKRTKGKWKTEFAKDTALNCDEWPYKNTIRNCGSAINGDLLLYGSTRSNFIIHKAVPVTSHSLRNFPRRPNNLAVIPMKNSLRQSATVLRLHGSSDGYCTIGRLYEEIPGNGAYNSTHSRNPTAGTFKKELIYGVSSVRRPPPTCRPPPPPSQESTSISSDSFEHSVGKESDMFHNGLSPKHSTDDEKSRNSGNSADNGRESGYGTAPSRLWNSPMITHQKRISLPQSENFVQRQTPLAIYAHHSDAHPMTYV